MNKTLASFHTGSVVCVNYVWLRFGSTSIDDSVLQHNALSKRVIALIHCAIAR